MKGLVFDIRRFSTHDGEGIRTTVFLKGCSLSCVWCQNPEGISKEGRPIHFKNKCISCGTCIRLCRNDGIKIEDGVITLDISKDENWEKIIYECPSNAIAMDSKLYTVDEIMNEVLKDKVFFYEGGGVTLSGGEPLLQSEFTLNLLKELKKNNINTAIESALNIKSEIVRRVVPYVDTIYSDFKIYDNYTHNKYVGANNELIKQNIKMLLESEKKDKVIIRTPLIPEFTVATGNIKSISNFISRIYDNVAYELLNYNPLAAAKYPLIDKKYCFQHNPKIYTNEQMKEFGEIAIENGIKNLIIES
jgi:pyruvate formate lyase activating enzyme